MDVPRPDEVYRQLDRLYNYRQLRGAKLRRILKLLVEEWLADRGSKLTLSHIGESLQDEPLTFEKHSDRWGYPKTRANLAHLRKRLRVYYEKDGYRDPIIIKLNAGSYAPVIAHNRMSATVPNLAPEVARLILRAKTAIDTRTVRGAWRALKYYIEIPPDFANARQIANSIFIPMSAAAIIPSTVIAVKPLVEIALGQLKHLEAQPWEGIFAEACAAACYRHDWKRSLDLFELAVDASQGEARYFWWYTALLACRGRTEEAMEILDSAVRHFSRTNLAVRTDLAWLQIMAGYFAEAEENLSSCLDFTAAKNPLLAFSLALLYEAQDRLGEAAAPILNLLSQLGGNLDSLNVDQLLERSDAHVLVSGMLALLMGRMGVAAVASQMLDILLTCKAKRPAASSVELAFACIGAGKPNDAVRWLRQAAIEESDPLAIWFHLLPPLRHLRGHSGYRALLRQLNLPLLRHKS